MKSASEVLLQSHSTSAPPRWADLTATFFGIGRLRPGPGTWASAATMLLWAAASALIEPSRRTILCLTAAAAVTIVGIRAATLVARSLATKDPQIVVIDEVAGQLVALIGAPLSWQSFLAGFVLFRVFDILKPPPVRQLEALPEGIGIVVDDLAAGLYALLVLHLFLHFRLLN